MPTRYLSDSIADVVHGKTVEILVEAGFCVPDQDALTRLDGAGFHVDRASQVVHVTPELLDTALARLPRDVKLFDRTGEKPAPFERGSCFMGAETPVNVLDLETEERRPATSSVRVLLPNGRVGEIKYCREDKRWVTH